MSFQKIRRKIQKIFNQSKVNIRRYEVKKNDFKRLQNDSSTFQKSEILWDSGWITGTFRYGDNPTDFTVPYVSINNSDSSSAGSLIENTQFPVSISYGQFTELNIPLEFLPFITLVVETKSMPDVSWAYLTEESYYKTPSSATKFYQFVGDGTVYYQDYSRPLIGTEIAEEDIGSGKIALEENTSYWWQGLISYTIGGDSYSISNAKPYIFEWRNNVEYIDTYVIASDLGYYAPVEGNWTDDINNAFIYFTESDAQNEIDSHQMDPGFDTAYVATGVYQRKTYDWYRCTSVTNISGTTVTGICIKEHIDSVQGNQSSEVIDSQNLITAEGGATIRFFGSSGDTSINIPGTIFNDETPVITSLDDFDLEQKTTKRVYLSSRKIVPMNMTSSGILSYYSNTGKHVDTFPYSSINTYINPSGYPEEDSNPLQTTDYRSGLNFLKIAENKIIAVFSGIMYYYTSANVQSGSVNYSTEEIDYTIDTLDQTVQFSYSSQTSGTTPDYPEYFPEFFPVELRFKLVLKNPRQNFSIKKVRQS